MFELRERHVIALKLRGCIDDHVVKHHIHTVWGQRHAHTDNAGIYIHLCVCVCVCVFSTYVLWWCTVNRSETRDHVSRPQGRDAKLRQRRGEQIHVLDADGVPCGHEK